VTGGKASSAGAGSPEDRASPEDWGPLDFDGHRVEPGESAEVRLRVGESYVAEEVSVPVTVVRGQRPGPRLFLTASVHGDELNGVGVIRDLLNDQEWDGLAGTLVAVPVANVPAFLNQDRRLPDRRDLNRSFPGNARGSLTARLAHVLFSKVIAPSDFGIDLHTGGGERTNYPQLRCDLGDERTRDMARVFGCTFLVAGTGPDRSLRRTALKKGVPTLVYEAGSPRRFERPFIEKGKTGVLNVMRHLGMLPGRPELPPLVFEIDSTRWVRARAGGILDLKVELGQPVRKGQEISLNTNPFGRERSALKAPLSGVVLGLTRLPLVHPGDAVCHLAKLDREQLAAWREVWAAERAVTGPPPS